MLTGGKTENVRSINVELVMIASEVMIRELLAVLPDTYWFVITSLAWQSGLVVTI